MTTKTTTHIHHHDKFYADLYPESGDPFAAIRLGNEFSIYFKPENLDALQSLIEAAAQARQCLMAIKAETEKKEREYA